MRQRSRRLPPALVPVRTRRNPRSRVQYTCRAEQPRMEPSRHCQRPWKERGGAVAKRRFLSNLSRTGVWCEAGQQLKTSPAWLPDVFIGAPRRARFSTSLSWEASPPAGGATRLTGVRDRADKYFFAMAATSAHGTSRAWAAREPSGGRIIRPGARHDNARPSGPVSLCAAPVRRLRAVISECSRAAPGQSQPPPPSDPARS